LKKGLKIFIALIVIIVVLAAVCCALLFTLVNPFKFMTLSDSKLDAAYKAYAESDVKLIAHRGLSVEEYQNTEAAFKLAAEDPDVWGIETDVWLTSDKIPVCMHDSYSLSGVEDVRKIPFAEAITTPLAGNHEKFAPTFDAFLEICKQSGKVAMIELKDGSMTEADIDIIFNKVKASGVEANYASFHYSILSYIRSKDSEVGLHLFTFTGLARDLSDAGATVKAKMQKVIDIRCNLSCNYLFLSKNLAKMFHDAGLKVGVWTVNSGRDAACLVYEYGVDFITTDVRESVLFKK